MMTQAGSRITTLSAFASALLAAIFMQACAPVTIRGTVVPGEISLIAVVHKDDARLDMPGIPDAKVIVRQTGQAGAVVERKASDTGRFSVPLKGTGALSRPMMVEVFADGYLQAREETMPTPTKSERLLVLMKPLRRSEP